MSWVSECADRWVGKGANEQQAMEGAIREALEHAAVLCDRARLAALRQFNNVGDGGEIAARVLAETIRELMVEP